MKKFSVILIAIFALAFVSVLVQSCTTQKTVAESSEVTKESILKAYSQTDLAKGGDLFTNNCAKCHKLFEPSGKDIPTWGKVLDAMIPKTKVSEEDGKLLRAYVYANSK